MKNPKILLIEDDKFFQNLIAKTFQKKNFDVVIAGNDKEAFAYLESNIPDLIILDLILIGLDGYEILSIVKKNKKTSGIPVIILSNLGQREEINRALSLGASDFMIKSNFTLEEIAGRVQKILKEK